MSADADAAAAMLAFARQQQHQQYSQPAAARQQRERAGVAEFDPDSVPRGLQRDMAILQVGAGWWLLGKAGTGVALEGRRLWMCGGRVSRQASFDYLSTLIFC